MTLLFSVSRFLSGKAEIFYLNTNLTRNLIFDIKYWFCKYCIKNLIKVSGDYKSINNIKLQIYFVYEMTIMEVISFCDGCG